MDRVQVRIACVTCNYGWTSELENQMENVVGWPWYWRRIEPLTEGGVIVLEAWGPQVSSGMERIRRRDPFLGRSEEAGFAFAPDATGARLLFRGQWQEAVARATFGWGRVSSGTYLLGFRQPRGVAQGS